MVALIGVALLGWAMTDAGTVLATPWPAELPCARPSELWFDAHLDGELTWASDDGADTRTFVATKSVTATRLPRAFPAARLTRLSGAALDGRGDSAHLVGVGCREGTEIEWGPCPDGVCAVRASYLGPELPKARQPTRHWTTALPGSPWEDVAPEAHWSRFLRDIGDKKKPDAVAARATVRFSRAFATELRDVLANACRPRRCGPLVREAQAALASFLRDRAPIIGNTAQREVDHWNYEWSWTATGGGVVLQLSCDDMTEDPDMLCDVALGLGELRLEYGTFHRDVELFAASDARREHRLGAILHGSTDRGKDTVEVEGLLLDLRAP